MLIKKSVDIKSSELTSKETYLDRRNFMRGAALVASTVATGFLYHELLAPEPQLPNPTGQAATAQGGAQGEAQAASKQWNLPGGGDDATPYQDITHYNNFYEFSTDKYSVARRSQSFVTRPWTVSVEGLVNKPKIYDLDELLKLAPQEDRIYRHRCVEGWSMVIPWLGFSLAEVLRQAEPQGNAQYVAFETVNDKKRNIPLTDALDWPYVEGLRLDEAMHPLATLASGIYGEPLLPQNGAPIRLVVPWKYGYKSIKSVVKISLVERMPPTAWNISAPNEYGFYSNVNPDVNHPRWSQASERRIGEYTRRKTLPFNGYGDQVAQLYAGMDLKYYF